MSDFKPLNKITTITATPIEEINNNIRANIQLGRKFIHDMASFKWNKGDTKIALIGGGPSVKDYLKEIQQFDGITVACGSVYDYLVDNNIIPTFCVLCDPDTITLNYISKASGGTIFLVATQCNPNIFEKLKFHAVYVWHCFNDNEKELREIDPNYKAVGGGCTVGLRALSIAVILGYSNIHFYGFDSCLEDEQHHAYDFSTDDESVGEIYEVKLVQNPEKVYKVAGYHLAQVDNFRETLSKFGDKFTPTFHGTGLLPDMMCNINMEIAKEAVNG